jgi:hypothetical protein
MELLLLLESGLVQRSWTSRVGGDMPSPVRRLLLLSHPLLSSIQLTAA